MSLISMRSFILLSLLVPSLSACQQTTEYGAQDGGQICVSTQQAPPGPAGESMWMIKTRVIYDECASGCTKVSSDCKITQEGQLIQLDPHTTATRKSGGDCPTECVKVQAVCDVPTSVATGDYSVVVGDRTVKVPVPGGNGPCGLGSEVPNSTAGSSSFSGSTTTP